MSVRPDEGAESALAAAPGADEESSKLSDIERTEAVNLELTKSGMLRQNACGWDMPLSSRDNFAPHGYGESEVCRMQ